MQQVGSLSRQMGTYEADQIKFTGHDNFYYQLVQYVVKKLSKQFPRK